MVGFLKYCWLPEWCGSAVGELREEWKLILLGFLFIRFIFGLIRADLIQVILKY